MTQVKLENIIRAGQGTGHRENYTPFLLVTKKVTSDKAFNGHNQSPEWGRLHHYRSADEEHTIQLLKWLGAYDIRDQYPAWPWTHEHPLVGLPGVLSMSLLPGLWRVAKDCGIAHGTYPGTRIPYIATIDLLTTWKEANRYKLVAYECKPDHISQDPDPLLRAKQRLELIRRYCVLSDIHRVVSTTEKFSKVFLTNLAELDPKLRPEKRAAIENSSEYAMVVERIGRDGYKQSPASLISDVSLRQKIPRARLSAVFRLAIWNQDIDHDISTPSEFAIPLRRGGIALKNRLLKSWVNGR